MRYRPASPFPPATSTFPFGSNVAVWKERPIPIAPVAVQVPVAGSYSSEVSVVTLALSMLPVTSTFPFVSKVAVKNWRAVAIAPVGVHKPVTGS